LKFLQENENVFPPSAFALGTANWYQNANEHRCPHDARLENFTLSESATKEDASQRTVAIRILLSAAYDDGFIEFFYPKVFCYNLAAPSCNKGHKDWVYDEFRLSKSNHVIHEIEWREDNFNWIIEASDVEYKWIPK
jgi:hypothetical protein